MYSPIKVVVRINPAKDNSESPLTLGPVDENNTIKHVKAGSQHFPVSVACPSDISQAEIFSTIIHPHIDLLFEGYDASVITYGQVGSGKTYTMFGPGINCAFSEMEHGIIPRTLREIFSRLSNSPEINFLMNISWFQIYDEDIKDLFCDVSSNVQVNSVADAFYWLNIGLENITKSTVNGHLLFTLCLEQQWINSEGYIQHRLSTMSFCDLAGTQRLSVIDQMGMELYVPKDHGLRSLENIIHMLSNANIHRYLNYKSVIPYEQSTLTTLLMDSLGGRAHTVLICCLSPLACDFSESIANLQIASEAQNIRNTVTINAFSDNNTPAENQVVNYNKSIDTFGLQFASSQWVKLVANAEGLFSRLISNKVLSEHDAEQIEEWLYLKQECDECLSSGENITKQLGSIQEEPCKNYSDSASEYSGIRHCKESESQNNYIVRKLKISESISESEGLEHSDTDSCKASELNCGVDNMMSIFRNLTINLTSDRFEHYILSQSKSTSTSKPKISDVRKHQSEFSTISFLTTFLKDMGKSFSKASVNSEPVNIKTRRRSVHPGQSLNSIELKLLQRAASSGSAAVPPKVDQVSEEPLTNDLDILKIKIHNEDLKLESLHKQIKTTKETMSLMLQLRRELMDNNDTRTNAKQKFSKKRSKVEYQLENAREHLVQANKFALNYNNPESQVEIEKWKNLCEHYIHKYEQRLKDMFEITGIANDSKKEVGKLQIDMQALKKQLQIQQAKKKEVEKTKQNFQKQIKSRMKHLHIKKTEKRSLKDVTSRISHLDQVLKQKSQFLLNTADTAEQQSVRTEIINLRNTRDHLQDQLSKLKNLRSLDLSQKRRLLECEEAIEAIDTAIEVKNERICGKTSILDIGSQRGNEGERMLMARLNKLTLTETRTLLYKYYQKVIDLKDNGHRLEKQVLQLEAQQESWEHALNDAVREATSRGERHALYLEHQYQKRVNLLLRHFTDETSTSANTERERIFLRELPNEALNYGNKPNKTKFEQCYYKDVNVFKEEGRFDEYNYYENKSREPKHKLLARLMNHNDRKSARESLIIPTQNLKQLQTSPNPTTKVTRKKNKLIIQQNSRQ